MKIQKNVVNVFYSHRTSNDASSSEIKLAEFRKEIQTLIERVKKVVNMWFYSTFITSTNRIIFQCVRRIENVHKRCGLL